MRPTFVRTASILLGLAVTGAPANAQTSQHVSADQLEPYVGVYRAPPFGTMAISRFDHRDDPLFLFTDFSDGWRGTLRAERGDTMRIVLRRGDAREVGPRLALTRNDSGREVLELHLEDAPVRRGSRIDLRIEPVEFHNDTVRLAGEIVLPAAAGPHPGIVFVHGSGPATRNDYREWSRYFAANGIATLVYDKRGAGSSTGDYRRASFEDLAADAAAAVHRLRAHPDVDDRRVGLSGGSQGAWVAPIAERMIKGLAFLVPTGGGPITPAEQEIYRRARIVQDSGYDGVVVETAREVVTAYFDYLGSGGDDPSLSGEVSTIWQRYGEDPWFALLDLPSNDPTLGKWPEGRRRFAAELHYDPMPSVRRVRTPTLAILGAEDQGFPTPRVAEAYRAAMDPSLLTVWIIPGVDHGFWVTNDARRGRHQSPEMFAGLLTWIWSQVGH